MITLKQKWRRVRRTIARSCSGCALSLLAACGAQTEGREVAELARAIDDAPVESGFPAVGSFDTPGDCTGTLVDRYWVLTAGHCDKDDYPLEDFLIGVGPVRAQMRVHRIDPNVQFSQPSSFGHEVTLHRLQEPIDDVPIIGLYDGAAGVPWAERVPVGETCTAIGYGLHKGENGMSIGGTKRSRETVIGRIDPAEPNTFSTDENINNGDSGGPLLCGPDRTIVGVAVSDSGQYATVDPAWIRYTIAHGEPPAEASGPPGVDPEQHLVSASGELCPPGAMEFSGGMLTALGTTYPQDDDGDGELTCSIAISVDVPAGKKLESPRLCVDMHSHMPPLAASLRYDFEGRTFRDDAWVFPLADADFTERCDTLTYASATCDDPTRPHTITYRADFSVRVDASTVVSPMAFAGKLWSPESVWSDCE